MMDCFFGNTQVEFGICNEKRKKKLKLLIKRINELKNKTETILGISSYHHRHNNSLETFQSMQPGIFYGFHIKFS